MAYNPAGGYSGPPPQQGQWQGGQAAYGQQPAGAYGQVGQAGYYPPYGAPPQQPSLMDLFRRADTNGDGRITHTELQTVLGPQLFNAETCRLMLGMFDVDRDGNINFQEFQGLWQYIEQWKRCFQSFDRDNSGTIDANELTQAFHQFGYRLSPQFCQNLIRRFDRQTQRAIKFDDFIQCCVMLKCFTEGFMAKDYTKQGVVNVDYVEFIEMTISHVPK
eukprot:comp18806_c0_seq1/m.20761 comp18806_c0_seq1/g.20761  ORF comp18806_c0_seq1/g.20761 comp18806_c0_seq1/m.20761 type:complete len:218 (-) comp18806_c0_seq1:103-756(-)